MRETSAHASPEIIGLFRIVRVLGEGGMGTVYLGERLELFSQRVAIKVLHPEISLMLGEEPLRHEEYVLTSLDHPGIVRLLDRGEYGSGVHYIVMEYVDGLPLLDYCSQQNLREPGRINLLIEMLQAVDYAHRHLIIHGDLKPQNVLVTETGHPKLLDFGVAALMQAQAQPSANSALHTPDFASPEQLSGSRLTPASDVYSLGKLAASVLISPESSDLRAVFEKSTRLEPEQRYTTARDFANDLQAVLDHRVVSARPVGSMYLLSRWMRRHRTAAAMAAAVLLAVCGSVTGVAIQTARAERQRRIAESRLHDIVRLTGTLEGELYTSVKLLPQAEPARAALLREATASLDKLAAQDGNDPTLAFEMAGQYRRLSSLQAADSGSDRRKAIALLQRIPRRDGNFKAAQALMADLQNR